MVLLGQRVTKRRLAAVVVAMALAALAGSVTARMTGGPVYSCLTCYERYPEWVCVWVWGCPDPTPDEQ